MREKEKEDCRKLYDISGDTVKQAFRFFKYIVKTVDIYDRQNKM